MKPIYLRFFNSTALLTAHLAVLLTVFLTLLVSCQSQSSLDNESGDLKVLIPDTTALQGSGFKVATLKSVNSLKTVSGRYVQFFYAPSATVNGLSGEAPKAQFVKSAEGFFVPTNTLSQQMATIYFHIQELKTFSEKMSPDLKSDKPLQVGLSTRIQNPIESENNAFFDGLTKALLFVPYDLQNTPISINAGILAHEYFHSLFYESVLVNFNKRQELAKSKKNMTAEDKGIMLYNETLIRGMNEGFADFWGWLYTNDDNYIEQSLPRVKTQRKLNLEDDEIGSFQTQGDINSRVAEAALSSKNPTSYLSGYIYQIGTPHAKLLRKITELVSEDNQISLTEAKLDMARVVYTYLKTLNQELQAQQINNYLPADHFFMYLKNEKLSSKLGKKAQELLKNYEVR